MKKKEICSARTGMISRMVKAIVRDRYLLLLILPTFLYFAIFCYIPIAGNFIAFTDYRPGMSMFDSEWVGFRWFQEFFNAPEFGRSIRNTLLISIYSLIFSFPAPVIFALMLNEVRNKYFKGTIQTLSYMPYFVSLVIVVGIMKNLLSVEDGIVNRALVFFGMQPINFMAEPEWFRFLYVASGIWQGTGWGSIVYLGALSAIDYQLYEAAYIDGASRFQRLWHITLPGISGTVIMMLIINVGNIMSVGYEKVILMYMPLTYETADVIQSYVYRRGLVDMQYSFATAVGLFNSVVNLILIMVVNAISRKVTEVGLW